MCLAKSPTGSYHVPRRSLVHSTIACADAPLAAALPFAPRLAAGGWTGAGRGTSGSSAGAMMPRDPPASSAGKSGKAPVTGSRFSMNHSFTYRSVL